MGDRKGVAPAARRGNPLRNMNGCSGPEPRSPRPLVGPGRAPGPGIPVLSAFGRPRHEPVGGFMIRDLSRTRVRRSSVTPSLRSGDTGRVSNRRSPAPPRRTSGRAQFRPMRSSGPTFPRSRHHRTTQIGYVHQGSRSRTLRARRSAEMATGGNGQASRAVPSGSGPASWSGADRRYRGPRRWFRRSREGRCPVPGRRRPRFIRIDKTMVVAGAVPVVRDGEVKVDGRN